MSTVAQASVAKVQRGMNGQPVSAPRRSGGEPGIPDSFTRGPCSFGNEVSRPLVYGWAARTWICSRAPDSTTWPAYMITTRSAISSSSERSWVMNRTEKPRRSLSSKISDRISRCTTTSSAVVGSSMITTSGSAASAIAIITRWRMPPDSSCG